MVDKKCEGNLKELYSQFLGLNDIEMRQLLAEHSGESTRLTNFNTEMDSRVKDILEKIDELVACECGPGKELKEVQLKIPIMISKTVEDALEKSGYDVGTDAYYADPERFVSVIVRPTKELELRSGG